MTDAPAPTAGRDEPPRPLLEDPRFLPFLPMLYVAWADGDLSDEELEEICAHLKTHEALDGECRELLGHWLQPAEPPTARELARLLAAIRRGAGELEVGERLSLTGLGLELARAGGSPVSDAERRALVEIERALGLGDSEAARQLLAVRRPPEAPAVAEASFDVAAMTRLLDGPHHELRRRVRRLLSGGEFRYRLGLDRHAQRELVLAWCRRLAEEGLGSLSFPPPWGGGDAGAFIAAFETVATHDLSLLVKFGVQFGLFGGSIVQLGTEEHHRRYLGRVATLELPGCFAMTETGHGSNVADLETVARYDVEGECFEIHTPHPGARKDYIGNAAAHGRMATVFAQLEIGEESHGVHAFLVPIRDAEGRPLEGVEIEDCGEKMGLQGVDNGRLRFHRVRVERRALLDRFAQVAADGTYTSPIASPSKRFFTMLGTLVGGRVSVALAGLAASKSALAIAVRYGAQRRQFGPPGEAETPLLDYLSHQRRLLPRVAASYAFDFALERLVARYAEDDGDDRREVEGLAAGLKALATWHATETIQVCRECCGGQGYLAVNRFAALKADSDVFTTFEGANVVLLQLVTKGLLTGYKRQMASLGAAGLLRFVAGRAATQLLELNPIVTRRTDEAHLRDPEVQLAAFRYREEHLLSTLARRLKRRLDGGLDAHRAFIECQDHVLTTARAHVERVVLEHFTTAVESCDDDRSRAMLTALRDLHALHRLDLDRGFFLETGYFEARKARAVRALVNRLCGEVRLQAVPLVDAFGIPPEVLAAPIAF